MPATSAAPIAFGQLNVSPPGTVVVLTDGPITAGKLAGSTPSELVGTTVCRGCTHGSAREIARSARHEAYRTAAASTSSSLSVAPPTRATEASCALYDTR